MSQFSNVVSLGMCHLQAKGAGKGPGGEEPIVVDFLPKDALFG